jgi:hypothetical protein
MKFFADRVSSLFSSGGNKSGCIASTAEKRLPSPRPVSMRSSTLRAAGLASFSQAPVLLDYCQILESGKIFARDARHYFSSGNLVFTRQPNTQLRL